MRRHFSLPAEDIDYLSSTGLTWETIAETGLQWILINEFPVPQGYGVSNVTVAVMIPPGYPVAPLDMAWFYPELKRTDAKLIGALSFQTIDQKPFQRWSRHRTGANPWRPGVDDLSAHLSLIETWLQRELSK